MPLTLRGIKGGKKVGHFVGVFLFFRQNLFDHPAGRRIVLPK